MRLTNKKKPVVPDGRKYRMAMIFAFAMLAGLALTGINTVATELYPQFITGLGMLYFIYCSGNVGNKWVLGKHGALQVRVGEEEEPEEEDPKPGA